MKLLLILLLLPSIAPAQQQPDQIWTCTLHQGIFAPCEPCPANQFPVIQLDLLFDRIKALNPTLNLPAWAALLAEINAIKADAEAARIYIEPYRNAIAPARQ